MEICGIFGGIVLIYGIVVGVGVLLIPVILDLIATVHVLD
jgi:hypothetical protein